MRPFIVALIAIPVVVATGVSSQQQDEGKATGPLDVGQVEQVEVQLVLLDVLALDRKDRTVPGLSIDQFALRVDGSDIQIASLDVDCPLGMAKDPRAGQTVEIPEPRAGAAPRRIVHAFDYYHMTDWIPRTIETAQDAIRKLCDGSEEHMIVTIGSGLRIESPFTSDLDVIDAALRRMYEDPSLYAGFYGRLTERPFYRRLASLIDFLELIDGPKIVVLYSGPFSPDGFHHDPEFKQISAMAAKARVALYPVDTGGLRTPRGFRYGDLGGPKELARLAVETGGRVTYHTNDLGLALARAQRDYGCRYTLGFYDTEPKPDQVRHVSISIKRDGVRAIYPVNYVLRSDPKRLNSQVRTAGMVPEMYGDGGMSVEAVILRPHGPSRWDVLIAARPPESPSSPASAAPWKLDGRIMTPSGAVVHRFEREWAERTEGSRTLFESMTLRPGDYTASIVLSREGMSVPWASRVDLELPALPVDEFVLVGPHLGWYEPYLPGDGEAITGPAWRFEPLIAGRATRGETVEALTWICRVGDVAASGATVERELTRDSGGTVGSFDPVRVDFGESEKFHCSALWDVVPTSNLTPGRYTMRAFVLGKERRFESAFDLTP